ncbi:uncharacterized protein LOC110844719 isoform X2 [Folsomia candida]|uniref:uncharacterized protein LOC110844719 isoform X2 n=1 Tax=Folsomia candida TaxID=158441 RepID=UPI000B8F0C75|nr:uncharacterized protein LOC110844719 isoform X2 [Folsomia candida]
MSTTVATPSATTTTTPPPVAAAVTTLSGGAKDIFELHHRLEIPTGDEIELYSKHSEGDVNFFALHIKSSGDLLLVSDHKFPFDGSIKGWTLKHIPWFNDPGKRVSAMAFDDEGILFLGTWDGTVLELRTRKVLGSLSILPETDILEICHLNNIRILHMLIYNQESNKVILCSGENNKFVILTNHAPPVLVTFTSNINSVDIFTNKAGLTCALVCLESGQNVYTILDDLDLPDTNMVESQGKKSIFRKAKDNLLSRLSEEKLGFFGKKSNKETSASPNNSLTNVAQSVLSTTTVAPSVIVGHVSSQKSSSVPLSNVKFQTIDETFRGLVKKIMRQNQFFRHGNNKLDLFDGDFRQTATTYVPPSVTKLFAIQRMYFAVDQDSHCLKVSIIIDSVFKEFACIPFTHTILAIEPFGEEGTPYTVFLICDNGIFEMNLRRTPLETCVELMLSESGGNAIDAVCAALNVPKNQVCVMAGDVCSFELKFSKTIIYYKLAGLSYAQICAKFGSRGQIPAMLFFYELVDQERAKAGSTQDRKLMTDLALLGRIEQYLRYGLVRSELPKNPELLLRKMLLTNVHYSSPKAAQYLAIPELLWALKLVGQCRCCYPDILNCLHTNEAKVVPYFYSKKLFWNLLTIDWLAMYTTDPSVFIWFRALVWKFLRRFTSTMILKLLILLLPWRRELQRKIFTEVSDIVNIIDFTVSPEIERIVVDDYVSLFMIILIEAVRRTSSNHCVCVRNGRVYTWGENKLGRLGFGENKGKLNVDVPTPISLPATMKLYIESVCAGHSHNIALTNVGTILVWGSNKFGQLGLGRVTSWTGRLVPLEIPNVIFTCIAAGSYHSCAIDHLNRVWTWGWGVFGQLGTGSVENVFCPSIIEMEDKIVFVSAGHSHTALLTCYGRVLIFGCNHFGQLGLGLKEGKVKVPTLLTSLPSGTLIRLVECGICCTVLVTTKNRLFYSGLNPASLKSLLSGAKRKEKMQQEKVIFEEEKDFNQPTLIDTSHMAGDITRVSASSTHFGVMTSLGYVYTWGIGKSGQLARNDDDSKTLELIDCDAKMIVVSDICCAGDCTFVVERDTGCVYGCGFNSSGQIGKMESDEEQSVMTVRTKKRVVKIRQPSNIYFRLKEIPGLPKQLSWEGESSVISSHKIAPHTNIVGQELLEWCLNVFRRNYDAKFMTNRCLEAGNLAGASLLETLAENHEQALRHNLEAAAENKQETETAINGYMDIVGQKSPSIEQACRFLNQIVQHYKKYGLPSSDLEDLLERQRKSSGWGSHLNLAIKELISTADDSSEWIASHLTPLFILTAIKDVEHQAPGLVSRSSIDSNDKGVISNACVASSILPEKSDLSSTTTGRPAAKVNGV